MGWAIPQTTEPIEEDYPTTHDYMQAYIAYAVEKFRVRLKNGPPYDYNVVCDESNNPEPIVTVLPSEIPNMTRKYNFKGV